MTANTMDAALRCPRCKAAVGLPDAAGAEAGACPACGGRRRVDVFPALYRGKAPGEEAQKTLVEGESACYHHAAKKAVNICDACGRFMCALCDIDLDSRHVCPVCFEAELDASGKPGTEVAVSEERILYDNILLVLAVAPMLVCTPVALVTGPLVIVLGIYWWKRSASPVRGRWRIVLAMAVATLHVSIGVALFISSLWSILE